MLKVLYAGSPAPAAMVLSALFDHSKDALYKIVGVLTNPPSAQGRHKALVPTPVSEAATSHGVSVLAPEHLDAACRDEVLHLGADILVCFAYGHIFGAKFLSLFPLGGVNLHPSLLPRYRGATPVPAAILNGDKETAATIQRLALGMDEGDILAQKRIPMDGTETAGSLLNTCAAEGATLLNALLAQTAQHGELPSGIPQAGEPSYTKVISKEDGRIDWTHSAVSIDAHIRAFTPAPGCWTMYKGAMLRILQAKAMRASNTPTAQATPGTVLGYQKGVGITVVTGDGLLVVTMLQRQGKKAMDAASFANGEQGLAGNRLGE